VAGRLNLSVVRSSAASLLGAVTRSVPLPQIGAPPGKLGVVQSPGKILFTLNGQPVWLIDVSLFAGTPTLTMGTTPNQGARVTLQGARLPGTQLPADFVLVLDNTGPLGTSADITFTLGGFHAQVILETWLAGQQIMQSQVQVSGDVCPLGVGSKLALSGAGRARFATNWLMEIGGPGVATISGFGAAMVSDSIALKLLLPGDPSISTHPKSKRTLLTLSTPSKSWHLKPQVTSLPIGNLTAADGLFSQIAIGAGEGRRATRRESC
jgi:hypothetical protein